MADEVVAEAAKKRPKVASVKPASGSVSGGTRITVSGRNFTKVRAVLVGGTRARKVRVLSPRKLTAIAPAGFAGRAPVKVVTKSGRSKGGRGAAFRYKNPRAVQSSKLVKDAGTVKGTGVAWVTGGTDYADPEAGKPAPWIVGIRPGHPVPRVGGQYYLAPGARVFPSGLVGKVTVVSTQADGITAVTVSPTALEAAFRNARVLYSGRAVTRGLAARNSAGTVNYGAIRPHAFKCEASGGRTVSFDGSVGLRLQNVRPHFDLNLGGRRLDAWVQTDVVLEGKVTADSAMNCRLTTAWQNANRKVIPLGTTGATVSFAPTASFSISGSGTLQLTHRSRRMVGVKLANGSFTTIDTREDLGLEVGAALSFRAKADAGVSVQFGALDRVGVEAQMTLDLDGKATAQTTPPRACVDLAVAAKLKLNAFLDVWFRRWESPSYSRTWPLAHWNKCAAPTPAAQPSQAPAISTTRLPNATRATPYVAVLATADNRGGTWSASGLPRGLTLDASNGRIGGIPTSRVGDYAFTVGFRDGQGRSDTQTVRLYIAPPEPVGGGEFQATLTWSSDMDLDLHVLDPFDEEISYRNKESASGGWLDRDANVGCGEALDSPIENVFWPPTDAPDGSYLVWAEVYSECSADDLSWHLVVRVNGRVVLDTTGEGDSMAYEVTLGGSPRVQRVSPPPVTAQGVKP